MQCNLHFLLNLIINKLKVEFEKTLSEGEISVFCRFHFFKFNMHVIKRLTLN